MECESAMQAKQSMSSQLGVCCSHCCSDRRHLPGMEQEVSHCHTAAAAMHYTQSTQSTQRAQRAQRAQSTQRAQRAQRTQRAQRAQWALPQRRQRMREAEREAEGPSNEEGKSE